MHVIAAIALVLMSSGYGAATSRHIKALAEEDVRGLLEGRGMGLAMAAELNHYPGPMHVLEMAEKLMLTPAQKTAVQEAHDRMKASALALGAEIVELERQLDQSFVTATIDEKRLAHLTAQIAERQGRLRYAHLAAHIATRAVLTKEQIHAYDEARGYGKPDQKTHHPGH